MKRQRVFYRRRRRVTLVDPLVKTHPYNEYIRVDRLRVINENGENLGIFEKKEALKLAREKGLDLVVIAMHANPPVAKLVNLGHFRYELQKKEKELKRKQKATKIKEVKFKPLIGIGDFERKIKQIKEFVERGFPVKVTIIKKRRVNRELQIEFKERLLTALQEWCNILDIQDKGNNIHILVKQKTKKSNNYNNKN